MFKAESYEGYKLCWPDDLVINSLWAWAGGLGVSRHHGIVSSAYGVYRLREGSEDSPAFFHNLVRSAPFQWELQVRSKGIWTSRLQLTDQSFLSALFPVPPPDEQAAIVRFLDYTNRRVRRYIRAKQKLIKQLDEQGQAIIQRAVMGQNDVRTGTPYPAYRDSGVEWLGQVPAQWEVTRLKHVLLGQLGNGIFKKKDSYGRGVPLVNVADVYRDDFSISQDGLESVDVSESEVGVFRVFAGDIFFVRSSLKLEGTGRSALLGVCQEPTVFECHLVRARPRHRRASARFLVLYLNSQMARDYLISRANTVTMSTLPQGAISTMDVALPRREDQDRIADAVDHELDVVHTAKRNAFRHVELILQYRSSLIADVVTGKLDVRKAAANLPDEADEPEPLEDEGLLTGREVGEVADQAAVLEEAEV
jgi:type I restriction enzyme S subunit